MQGDFQRDDKGLGRDGESLAASYLRTLGYRILERNFRCRLGEVDLIVARGGTITFVEVKTRRSVEAVSPRELVTLPKQRHISKVAQHYLATRRHRDVNAGFAVLGIDFSGPSPRFEWIPNAFELAWGY
ncbi:MAG TPA: YraN family protein [bacterium]|nr:YraN family protein [bacterium]